MIRKFRYAIVTGGAGFIGSHLSKYLISQGIKVTVIDNFSTGNENNLKSIRSKITLINSNICDDSIDDYFKNTDVVFNCAAMVGVKLATSKPLEVLDQNISNVRKILDLCRKNNALHIFISSSEVYGNSVNMPVSENSTLVPVSPYGVSKIVGETYCSSFKRKYGINSIIIRLFNVYGPGQDANGLSWVLPSFIIKLLQNQKITIHGTGEHTRDFTFIDDSVKGIFLASVKGNFGEAYNIGTGVETSISDLGKLVINKMNLSNNKLHFTRNRSFQIYRRVADTKKARNDLGFTSSISLSTGVSKTISFFKLIKNTKIKSKNG